MSEFFYSVVVPVFNEEQTIAEFNRRVTESLARESTRYEVIYVDDGSRDNTVKMISTFHLENPRIKLIQFSRNFGQQTAITCGLSASSGDAVIVLDADLQDPPEFMAELIAKWKEGYEVVYAIRRKRKEGVLKRAAYAIFYRILRKIASVEIPHDSGDFSLIDRKIVEALERLPEKNRFLRGLRAWVGYRQVGIKYEREARYAGVSKYSLIKLFKLAYDGIIGFSYVPLRLSTFFGFMISIFNFIFMFILIFVKLSGGLDLPGWTSTNVLILFLGGVQLIAVGIIGEYLARIYDEVKQRPPYLVKNKIGF